MQALSEVHDRLPLEDLQADKTLLDVLQARVLQPQFLEPQAFRLIFALFTLGAVLFLLQPAQNDR